MKITVRGNIDTLTVSRFQAKAALLQLGMLDAVQAEIDAAPPLVKLAWNDASEFCRQSPAILGIAQARGWSAARLDELFSVAARIVGV